jgi:hypothetical protein
MFRVYIFILLAIIVVGCKQTNSLNNEKFLVFHYSERFQFDSIDTIDVHRAKLTNSFFIYKSNGLKPEGWSTDYRFCLNDSIKPYSVEGTLKVLDRKFIRFYYPKEKTFYVYRLLAYDHSVDSQTLHFWIPEFGIILSRSLTWRTFDRYEFLDDENKNQIIRNICFLILDDKDFYNLDNWEDFREE